jgi:hypothetical protein
VRGVVASAIEGLRPGAVRQSNGAASAGLRQGKEGRMFFFEKKNQKTFTHGNRPKGRATKPEKFFASFFSKKKGLLS